MVQIWGHLCKVQFKDWEIWNFSLKRIPMNLERTLQNICLFLGFKLHLLVCQSDASTITLGEPEDSKERWKDGAATWAVSHAVLELKILGYHSWETSAPVLQSRNEHSALSLCTGQGSRGKKAKSRAHEERDLTVGQSNIFFLRKQLNIWDVVNTKFTFCTMLGCQDQLQNLWTEYVNLKFLNMLKFQATAALCNCLPIFSDVSIFWYLCTWCKMFWKRTVKQNFLSFC